jgi:hypothetical protein
VKKPLVDPEALKSVNELLIHLARPFAGDGGGLNMIIIYYLLRTIIIGK